jgi:hypothetical protein
MKWKQDDPSMIETAISVKRGGVPVVMEQKTSILYK